MRSAGLLGIAVGAWVSACGEAPTTTLGEGVSDECRALPPSSPLSLRTSIEGKTIRWSIDAGCIEITYAPELSALGDEIAAAARAWDEIECSELCFEDPYPSERPLEPADKRRIHLQADGLTELATGMTYEQDTGDVLNAMITIDPAIEAYEAYRLLVSAFGSALGFEATMLESVLNPASGADRPTPVDVQAVCAIYGPPICAP